MSNSPDTILLSICICTHNRFSDVEECLAALSHQVRENGEIIVIDSASNVNIKAALEILVGKTANASLIRLEQAGLSLARNAGIAASRGQWVAFLDDDAVPFHDYFDQAVSVIANIDGKIGFWGGRLKPRWPNNQRPNIGAYWQRLLSLVDDETPDRETEAGLIYGANIFYRRTILNEFSEPFDPSLGRIGNCLLSGDEMGLHHRVISMGYGPRFFGSVGAEHKVSQSRLEIGWLRQRAYWDGITLIAIHHARNLPYGGGSNLWRQMLKILSLLPRALFYDADKEAYIRIWISLGVIRARILGIPKVIA